MGGMIKGITVEIGGNTTKLITALKGVNSTTKSLQSELRGVNSLLKMDPGNVTLLQQKQDLLTKSVANTEDKLNALKQAQKEVQEQFEKGDITEEQYRDFQREIVATEKKLESLKKEAENFGSVHAQQIAAAGEKMKNYGDKITDAGKTMSKVSGVIVGVGTAAVKTTADFDAAMSNVQAISGATGEQFEKLRDKAVEMGSKTKFSASESADALTYMAMAGWKTDEMLDGLEGIMNAAAATGSDLATTSDIITDALTAFGMEASESGHMADVLTKASNNANTNIEMLGETFKYVAPVCGTLGISLEDCAVAAGLMGNAGIKASDAGTSMRKGLLNLASPTKSVAEAMEAYNIKLIENEDGSINLMKTMQNMRTQLGGLSEAEQTAAISAIAGKNAVSGWAAIVNASDDDFNKLTAAIADSNGAAKEASEIQLDNLKGQITILKSTLEGIAIQIGDILMPIVREIVAKIQEWTSKFSALDDGTKRVIVIIAGVVAAIGPLLLIIGKVMSSIGSILMVAPKMVKAFNVVKTAISGALSAHPAILVIAAIAAVIAIVISLYKNCEPFREFVDNLWAKIKQFFIDVGEWFKGLGDKISQTWENVKTFFTKTIPDTINSFVEKIKNFFTVTIPEAIQTMIQWFSELPYKIGYAIGTVLNTIKEFILKVWDFFTVKIPEYIGIMIEWFKGLPSKIQNAIVSAIDKIGDWCSKMKNKITTGVKNLIDSTVKFFKELPGKIKDAISKAIDNISQWCTDMKTKASNGIKNVATAVINGFKELPSKIKNVGKNIVEGLWNGITNMKNWVKNKVKGFADDILKGMKDALGIHSPSRVFRDEVGKYIAEGVGEGITSSKAPIDAIDELNKNMLDETNGFNGITLKRQIDTTFKGVVSKDGGLLQKLDAILTKLDKNTKIVLDSGVLVGETVDDYDEAMSDKGTKLARGW